MAKKKTATHKMVDMGLIDEPDGVVRLEIDPDKIKELSESIKAIGQLQPILLRPKNERYEIVFGHRRFLATQLMGSARISAIVKVIDDEVTALMRATENIAREDLTLIEEAAIYKDLRDRAGLRVDQIGKKMGKTPGLIKRRLDLLRMPPCLQKSIHEGSISYGVAEELWRLGEVDEIEYLLQFAVDHGITVTVARQWVKDKLDERRRRQTDVGGGGMVERSPLEVRPTYYACDICTDPVKIELSKALRVCVSCVAIIKKASEVKP